MDGKLWLELFGYFGTALVLISFTMSDIKWLRMVNIAGGTVSLIYAICVNTMPVVVLNASLIVINSIQLIYIMKGKRKNAAAVNNESGDAYDKEEKEKEDSQ